MKRIFASAAMAATVLAGSMAMAQLGGGPARVRVFSPNMTCAQVQSAVKTHGAVIIYSSAHIYDRYVAHRGYCSSHEEAQSAWVPTSDSASCLAGSVCRVDDRD